jgi:hypothetical protein
VHVTRAWTTPPENTDYLTHPLSFELLEVKANHLLVSVNESIEP